MWEGRREEFPHPKGPRHPNLTRYFKRSEEERLENPVRLEKYLHDITWEVGSGETGALKWEGLCCPSSIADGPQTPNILVSGALFEPLFLKGAEELTTA